MGQLLLVIYCGITGLLALSHIKNARSRHRVAATVVFDYPKIESCEGFPQGLDRTPYHFLVTDHEDLYLTAVADYNMQKFFEGTGPLWPDLCLALSSGISNLAFESRGVLALAHLCTVEDMLEPLTAFPRAYLRRGLLQILVNERALTFYGMSVFLVIVIALCLVLQAVSHFRSLSTSQDVEKRSEYECGFAPFDSATRLPFDVHFYLVGILFLVFDVEISLLFPWSVSLLLVGWSGVFAMIIFLYVLTVGFIFEWQRGALIWPSHYSTARTTLADSKWQAILPAMSLLFLDSAFGENFIAVLPPTPPRAAPFIRLRTSLAPLRQPFLHLFGKSATSIWPLTYLRLGECAAPELRWDIVDTDKDKSKKPRKRQRYDLHRLHPNQLPFFMLIAFAHLPPLILAIALANVVLDFAWGDMREQIQALIDLSGEVLEVNREFLTKTCGLPYSESSLVYAPTVPIMLLPRAMYHTCYDSALFVGAIAAWWYITWYMVGSLRYRKLVYYFIWQSEQEALQELRDAHARSEQRALAAIHPDKGRTDFSPFLLLITAIDGGTDVGVLLAALLGLSTALLTGYTTAAFSQKQSLQLLHPVLYVVSVFLLIVCFCDLSYLPDRFWSGGFSTVVAVAFLLIAYCEVALSHHRMFIPKPVYAHNCAFTLVGLAATIFLLGFFVRAHGQQLPLPSMVMRLDPDLWLGLLTFLYCVGSIIYNEFDWSRFRGRLLTPSTWIGRVYLSPLHNYPHVLRAVFLELLEMRLRPELRTMYLEVKANRATRKAKLLARAHAKKAERMVAAAAKAAAAASVIALPSSTPDVPASADSAPKGDGKQPSLGGATPHRSFSCATAAKLRPFHGAARPFSTLTRHHPLKLDNVPNVWKIYFQQLTSFGADLQNNLRFPLPSIVAERQLPLNAHPMGS